jgi:hypothetical protein
MSYDYFEKILKNNNIDYTDDVIYVEWIIGGREGGSCWGTRHSAINVEPEPELIQLDQILERVCPNISFLQYKRLCQELIKIEKYTDNGYYGNYTDYCRKYVNLPELWRYLCEVII